ncbi:hypothetical protein D3C73_693350 [compost metagenome]
MKNINLLPKIPIIQQIFVPVIVGLSLFFISAGGYLLFVHNRMANDAQQVSKALANTRSDITRLQAQQTIDPLTKDYQVLLAEKNTLMATFKDWIPVYELIASSLPSASRLINAGMADNSSTATTLSPNDAVKGQPMNKLQLSLEFANLDETAFYMTVLQQSTLIDSVNVRSTTRVVKDIAINPPVVPTHSTSNGSSASTPTATNPPAEKMKSPEELAKELSDKQPIAQTEGDSLLNSLNWVLNQELIEKNYGIRIPGKEFQVPNNPEDSSTSPLTDKDFHDARSVLESIRKQSESQPIPPVIPGPITSTPTTEPPIKLVVYKVELELNLVSIPTGK